MAGEREKRKRKKVDEGRREEAGAGKETKGGRKGGRSEKREKDAIAE